MGKIVVSFMNIVLNIASILLLIIGTIGGAKFAGDVGESVTWGAVIGFIASFITVVIFCGVAFLALEINNNLIRLNEKVADANKKNLEGS